MRSSARFCRLRSVHRRTHSPGKASSARASSGAGQRWFLGGTFVATYTVSERSRTTWPTSCSLWPLPYASAVSMKFRPSSMAVCSAFSDSSSWAPSHCDPPIPQAP